MPHLSGTEFLREARKLCPNVPALIITGYAEAEISATGQRTSKRCSSPSPRRRSKQRWSVCAGRSLWLPDHGSRLISKMTDVSDEPRNQSTPASV